MPFSELSTLLLWLIAFLAGFIQGLSGFGSVLVALPLLALLLDFKIAVPLVNLWSLAINTLLLVQLRGHLSFKNPVIPLFLAALPGIPLGVYILRHVPVWVLEMGLGGTLLVFSWYFVSSGGKTRNLNSSWAYAAGFCSGCLGGSLGASGPPVILYTALQPWPKDQIKATLASYFFLSGLLIIAAQAAAGLVTTAVLIGSLLSIPFVILGVLAGASWYRRLDTSRYRQVVVGLIILLGLLTVVKALGG
jgi:uncharacterized membrane protein YfcA